MAREQEEALRSSLEKAEQGESISHHWGVPGSVLPTPTPIHVSASEGPMVPEEATPRMWVGEQVGATGQDWRFPGCWVRPTCLDP